MGIKIVSDSSSDLLELDGVEFVSAPLTILTSEKEYVDSAELDVEEMVDYMRAYNNRSYTACPAVAKWEEAYGDKDDILAFTITSGLSGSFNAANTAKINIQDIYPQRKIHVFDTLTAGPEITLQIEKAKEMVKDGLPFEKIVEELEKYKDKTHLLFALKSLHNFAQNGRVSKVVAAASGMLGIRVLGEASQLGTLSILDKCKGGKRTLNAFVEEMINRGYAGGKVMIGHCFNSEESTKLKEMILSKFKTADVKIHQMRGLCCYYAEKGGILVGFES